MRWYDRPCPSLVFYNVRGCPAIHCIAEDGTSWLNYADTLSDKRRLQAVAANYWRRHQLLPPIEVTADCQNVDFCRHQQIVFYHGYRICMVTDNRWRNKSAASPLFINYMYLCKMCIRDRYLTHTAKYWYIFLKINRQGAGARLLCR